MSKNCQFIVWDLTELLPKVEMDVVSCYLTYVDVRSSDGSGTNMQQQENTGSLHGRI